MATPRSKDARKFYRAAARRLEESQFLLQRGGYTTASVYLAGYAVECILKALILSSEPIGRNAATLKSFRGEKAHRFEWLREHLAERGVRPPVDVERDLAKVNSWTTSLRYEPRTIRREDAALFLQTTNAIFGWAKGRI